MFQRARLAGEGVHVLFAAVSGRCGPTEALAKCHWQTQQRILVETPSSELRVSKEREGPLR